MGVLFSNSAKSKLAANLSSGATLLAIDEDDAWKFPSPAGGDWFPLTLFDAAGNIEYVKCTGRAAAILTIVRAQEGTTAKTFLAGSGVSHRLTAAALQAMRDTQSTELDAAVSALEDSISDVSDAVGTLSSHVDGVVGAPPTDLNSLQKIAAAIDNDADFATTVAALIADAARLATGTVPTDRLPVRLQSGNSLSLASQAEAEAGTEDSKAMTALRVKQAIQSFAPTKSGSASVVSLTGATSTEVLSLPANIRALNIDMILRTGGNQGFQSLIQLGTAASYATTGYVNSVFGTYPNTVTTGIDISTGAESIDLPITVRMIRLTGNFWMYVVHAPNNYAMGGTVSLGAELTRLKYVKTAGVAPTANSQMKVSWEF